MIQVYFTTEKNHEIKKVDDFIGLVSFIYRKNFSTNWNDTTSNFC